ncbi:transglutaminase domain-containing protein, partial [Candidatus Collierbacteria bacterium]|nr:transglutaminase domain-containing protein [Candidatus Collierbacteria bacterium]
MRFLRSLLILLLAVGWSLKSVSMAYAIPQFTTDYQVTYEVNEKGQTHVIFDVSQKNNLSTVYATSFSLSVSQTNLKNIQVNDSFGPIRPDINLTNNLTNISFDFVNKIVGKDKENRFNIQYDSADIANHQGSIWEINIPKLESNENTNSVQIILKVPQKFGQPAYIDPKPIKVEGNVYHFNSATLANKSISAVFGTTQYFKLDLTYNLKNPYDTNLTTQIALPPQTPYQDIYIEKIDPPAKDIQIDADGNFMASYQIKPNSNLVIATSIYVKLTFNPKPIILENNNTYTRSTKYWNYEDLEIENAAKGLKTPKAIYDYVTNTLSYNYNRLDQSAGINDRQGASWALANPLQAICTEFTDLFIALARKNNIPTRELQGFALSNNDKLKPISLEKDVLHAWPEYYDNQKQTWVQIDPTWGNTTGSIDYFNKLDLNHVVFAIHGTDPTQPLPAGAYKTPQSNTKDVFARVISPVNFPQPEFEIKYDHQDRERIYLTLINTKGVAANVNILKSSVHIAPFGSSTI